MKPLIVPHAQGHPGRAHGSYTIAVVQLCCQPPATTQLRWIARVRAARPQAATEVL